MDSERRRQAGRRILTLRSRDQRNVAVTELRATRRYSVVPDRDAAPFGDRAGWRTRDFIPPARLGNADEQREDPGQEHSGREQAAAAAKCTKHHQWAGPDSVNHKTPTPS